MHESAYAMRRSALLLIVLLSTALAAKAHKPVAVVRDATYPIASFRMNERVAPLAVEFDTCTNAIALAESWSSDGKYDAAFDTMLYYVRHCYLHANPVETFNALGSSAVNQMRTQAGQVWVRSFLLQALYLRNDDLWFCRDVISIGGTFYIGQNIDERSWLCVLKYLLDNPRCASMRNQVAEQYRSTRSSQITTWQDTMHAPEVFDSTLPTMHDLGLDSVLNLASVLHSDITGSTIISSVTLAPNPSVEEAHLALTIEREAFVHVELFDVLGNRITNLGFEGVCERGRRIIPLDLHDIPSGSYYVRIYTANNETRTLRLLKE